MLATLNRPQTKPRTRTRKTKRAPLPPLPFDKGQEITCGTLTGEIVGFCLSMGERAYTVRTYDGRTGIICDRDNPQLVPIPTAAECGVCWDCGEQFQPCDVPRVSKDSWGKLTTDYKGRKITKAKTQRERVRKFGPKGGMRWVWEMVTRETTEHTNNRDRLTVPGLSVFLCRECSERHHEHTNGTAATVTHVDPETGATFKSTWPKGNWPRSRTPKQAPPKVALHFESEAVAAARASHAQDGAAILIDPSPKRGTEFLDSIIPPLPEPSPTERRRYRW